MKLETLIYQIGIILVSVLSLSTASSLVWKDDECSRTLREAKDVPRQPKGKPKLSGHWTSSKCEIRPGPEFVLRKYSFRKNKFHAQIFYYADEYCSHVTHYISSKGTVKISRSSWRTPGAYESKYSLSQVSVIPYTISKAKSFEKILNRFCKKSNKQLVSPYTKFKIFRFTKYEKGERLNTIDDDFDCLKVFNYSMNELQLIRVERRYAEEFQRRNNAVIETELLLGDISTKMKLRRQYRPTHYQIPLKREKTPKCDVCQKLANSSRLKPPLLKKRRLTQPELTGDWVSQRCETRPNGQYLTRYLTFNAGGMTWKGVYEFFKDPLCKEPYFSLDVKGNFASEGRSGVIVSAHNYAFRTTRIKVTPIDYQMVLYLNSYDGAKCGKPKTWKIRKTQDVTYTKGCVTLGITLPNIEHELIRTDQDNQQTYLYVGQRPSDFTSMASTKNRPTSFQTALVKCGGRKAVTVSPYRNVHAYNVFARLSTNSGTSSPHIASNQLTVIVVLIVMLCYGWRQV